MTIFQGLKVPEVVFETDSKYNGHIQVVKFGDVTKIKVDGFEQSISPNSKACSRLYWGKAVDILKERTPQLKNILILGLCGGTIAHLLAQEYPGIEIVGVEIDQVMIDIAKEYMNLDVIPNLRVIVDDAMRVVIEPEDFELSQYSFDAVLVDVYVGEKYPDLGTSGNFMAALKRMVRPGGIIVFNRIYREHHQDEVNVFIDSVEETLANVKCTVVAGYTNSDNVLISGLT